MYHAAMAKKSKHQLLLMEAAKTTGGIAALAGKLGLTRQALYQWKRVPPEWVLKVEKLTGASRHDLRPDIYGPKP
jgi:DNA-binding transcriptional regulator YdaS (Cro superfamily)